MMIGYVNPLTPELIAQYTLQEMDLNGRPLHVLG
jgi:hypothetical protein